MKRYIFLSILLFQLSIYTFGAILPHQGRVLISGSAFEGTGLFRFALVDQSGAVVWNHEGGVGDPQNSLSISVEKGFYQCRLGDTSTQGMAPLPDTIFTPENPLKLRIWFDDGTNGLQRLGQDQNLMMAPYAMTSPRSESEKIAMRFADEIIRQAGTSNISVDELIERISSFAQQATKQGTITKDMLPEDLFNEMNKTVQMFYNSESMISDLNRTLNQALVAINRPLTMDMLPDDLVYDINQTKIKYEDSLRIIYDLNGSLTLLKQTVERPITRDMLPESVRNDLNRTISKSMLGADVLADLNRSKKVSVDLLEDGAVSTAKLDPIILKYLKPEIRNQPRANAVVAGNDLNITVNAEGKYLTFQWQKDGIDLPGEKNPTLSLSGYTPSVHNGKYVAVVSNDFGSVQTNPLSLNVQMGWDMNVTQISASSPLYYLLGNGDLLGVGHENMSSKIPVVIDSNVKTISANWSSVVYIKFDGSLWGLGNPSSDNGPSIFGDSDKGTGTRKVPVMIVDSGVVDVSNAGGHLMFIKEDGSLWGIGDNSHGELGDGTTIDKNSSTLILESGVVSVSANSSHTMFIKSDKTLWAMGRNNKGILGNGVSADLKTLSPIQIATNVSQVSAGFQHTSFVKQDGSLWAMGYNHRGRLGDGTTVDRHSPVQIVQTGVVKVGAGDGHTIFLKNDGSLWTMGFNSMGQLGDGTTEHRFSPTEVLDQGVKDIARGHQRNFFLKEDGSIWGMGRDIQKGVYVNSTPIQIPQLLSYDDKVKVEPQGWGSVGGYKNTNGTATLIADPVLPDNPNGSFTQSHYVFSHWSGDFGTSPDANLTVPFDSNVTAHFIRDSRDPDGDGLSNYEEIAVHGTNPDVADMDFDGFSDGEEITNGTDPKSWTVPPDYVEPPTIDFISEINSTSPVRASIIRANSNGQVAVGGENGVEIYQVEDNGSIRLITTIDRPSQASSSFAREIVLAEEFILLSDSHMDHMKCYIYSIGSQESDFALIDSVPFYSGEISPAIYGRLFAVPNNPGWNENPRTYKELDFINVYRYEENMTISVVTSLTVPSSTEVLGDISNDPRGVLDNFSILSNDLTLHKGVVALPFYYARFKKENTTSEWMYVVRMSVDQNRTLSIHEPSAPGRISSMVMDDEQLIVNHTASYPEVGSFLDTFRLSDGNRTTFKNTPGSNEHLGSGLALDGNGAQLYSASGPLVDNPPIGPWLIPNKTLSLPLPLSESSLPVAQYPTSSGKFTLTDKYFVSLDSYTTQNLQNNPQNYHVLRVYPKVANVRPSPTHTVDLNSSVNLEMIWVEPGTFTMGSPVTEVGRQSDSEDEHNVTLTKGFYLGKYEVTQAQYEAVMTGNTDGLSATPSEWPNNPNRPVEKVSWEDAQVFLTRLNEQQAGNLPAGWSYVLPTEAEWEYACRAGTTTAYSWGDDINSTRANYSDSGLNQTRDVGYYAANPWGFFDMHGNVWEWTADWYQAAYPTGNPVVDPTGPASGSLRVLRGGSWGYGTDGTSLRSARRTSTPPSARLSYLSVLGFRVGFQKQ